MTSAVKPNFGIPTLVIHSDQSLHQYWSFFHILQDEFSNGAFCIPVYHWCWAPLGIALKTQNQKCKLLVEVSLVYKWINPTDFWFFQFDIVWCLDSFHYVTIQYIWCITTKHVRGVRGGYKHDTEEGGTQSTDYGAIHNIRRSKTNQNKKDAFRQIKTI